MTHLVPNPPSLHTEFDNIDAALILMYCAALLAKAVSSAIMDDKWRMNTPLKI